MNWGNCEDHYSRVAKKKERQKPMDARTKLIIISCSIFIIGVVWTFIK